MVFTQTLNRNADFQRLYHAGAFCSLGSALLYVMPNGLPYNRLGITAGKKIGNAVKRKVSYTSVSGGKTYTSEGATHITYKRVFVAKGDQVDNWVTIGDPTNVVSTDRPIALPLFDEKQSDMVLYAMSMFSTIRAYV